MSSPVIPPNDPPGRPRLTIAAKYLIRISHKKTSGRTLTKFGKCPLVYGAADQLVGYHLVSNIVFSDKYMLLSLTYY